MCLAPVTIPNPYLSARPFFVDKMSEEAVDYDRLVSQRSVIEVPCGKCLECRQRRVNDLVVRAYVESMSSYVYSIMLSYNNEHIPYFELRSASSVQPVLRFAYSDISHIQNMFKRLRNLDFFADRDFRYLYSSEFGEKRHRPHWHILLFVARRFDDPFDMPGIIESILKENLLRFYSVNVGTRKEPVYEPLLTPRTKVRRGKTYTNYYVKYVSLEPDQSLSSNEQEIPLSNLVGYIAKYFQKDDPFFSKFSSQLREVSDLDPVLFESFLLIAKPKLRYSKGFGLGFFDNGLKVFTSPSYYSRRFMNSTLRKTLAFLDFRDFALSLDGSCRIRSLRESFLNLVESRAVTTFSSASNYFYGTDLEILDLLLHCDTSFRREVFSIYPDFHIPPKFYPNSTLVSWIRDVFPQNSAENSIASRFIRDNIHRSISDTQRCFFSVDLLISGKILTFALPKFYKLRFLTFYDLQRFLDVRHIYNIDDLPFEVRTAESLQLDASRLRRRREVKDSSVDNSRLSNPFCLAPPIYDTSVLDYDAVFSFDESAYDLVNLKNEQLKFLRL